MTVAIHHVTELPCDIEDLVDKSREEGFRFLERLLQEWRDRVNRFSAPGEALFVARSPEGQLCGVCGLNRDPFLLEPSVGRLRHLYVTPAHRRKGVGAALTSHAIALAARSFRRVRLRTDTEAASRFYRSLGFKDVSEPHATHSRTLLSPLDRVE